MFSLNIINQSFIEEGDNKYLLVLQKLFDFFSSQEKWKDLVGEINLVLIDNAEIQKLNKEYRSKNIPTDVLSFPYVDLEEILSNHDTELVVGEVFISKDKAKEDALLYKITFQEELNKLFVHGILHILGYDHIDDNDFFEMEKMEKLILNAFEKEKNCE